MNDFDTPPEDITQRLELLERENQRLRRRIDNLLGPEPANFNVREFNKQLTIGIFTLLLPVIVLGPALAPAAVFLRRRVPNIQVMPGVPLVDLFGVNSGRPGIGFGVIAVGGLAVGAIAIGGGAVGIVAIGGGAFGLIAMGGGAVGVLALGGGAAGYIAIGGGAYGRYVLAGDGHGRYVFSRKRQDPEAVELFTRYLPRLKRAFQGPAPVIPVDEGPRA